jgi:maltooligosyltrehalose trehalohydrolase
MIFQGEEWAASSPFQYFADHEDADLARAVSAGRTKEFEAFGWDPDSIPDPEDRATYLRSILKWDEAGQGEHARMRAWYRDLIRLRRSRASLNDSDPGNVRVAVDEDNRWLTLEREEILLCCNLGAEDQGFSLANHFTLLLASRSGIAIHRGEILLPPDSVAILERGRTDVL